MVFAVYMCGQLISGLTIFSICVSGAAKWFCVIVQNQQKSLPVFLHIPKFQIYKNFLLHISFEEVIIYM